MIGTIERIKNNVLLKCSTLNDEIISDTLINVLNTRIYRFAEEMTSLVSIINLNEEDLRKETSNILNNLVIKKIKRKLFIDSLALQITNDSFIEDYANDKITIKELENRYIKELLQNQNSNQLNMTEDLDLTQIFKNFENYAEKQIIDKVKENETLTRSVRNLLNDFKTSLESDLKSMIDSANNKYMDILIKELKEVLKKEENVEIQEGEDVIMTEEIKETNSKFEKYDDMTLFNKLVLCLNTAEEKLARKEAKLEETKKEIEEKLTATNKNIEANIQRENELSQRKLELNNKENELNTKLSEAEVIFLNIKPLVKGLSKINESALGGSYNE